MKVRALVLDDSAVMRTMLTRALSGLRLAEFQFTEAEDGEQGLDKMDSGDFELIFADWNMPNISGIQFARKVRANKKHSSIPIVMVTSENTVGKMEEALKSANVNAYICKPFTAEYLARKVAPIIDQIEKSQEQKQAGGGFFGKLMGR